MLSSLFNFKRYQPISPLDFHQLAARNDVDDVRYHLENGFDASCVIIFFNLSGQSDDAVKIIDKNYEIEERFCNIGLLFVVVKTNDIEQIGTPKSVVLD